MSQFIGNLSDQIDFDQLMSSLTTGYHEKVYVFDRNGNIPEDINPDDIDYVRQVHEAGYSDPICDDLLFYPHYHFDENLIYKLDRIFGTVCNMCWIECSSPGRVMIPHQDYDDRENILEKYGSIIRYHIHLGKPVPGQVMILKDHAHHMEAQGNCYKWDHHLDWTSGSNSSFTHRYVLNYRGIVPHPEHEDRFKDFNYIWSESSDSVRIKIKKPVKVII